MPRSNRSSWITGFAVIAGVALFIAACGGGDDDSDGPPGPGGADSNSTPTQESGNNGAPTQSGGDATATSSSGGGGADAGDIDGIMKDLVPPKSTEILRYSSQGTTSVSYESTDSLDSLKSFYDKRLKDLDLKLMGNMSTADTHSWFVGSDDGKAPQGSVTIFPSGTAGKVAVTITLGPGV